jgi:hypothetical protein
MNTNSNGGADAPKKLNKQLYENSELKELFAADGGSDESRVRGFFNPLDPNMAILHEKPHHRVLLLCKMQGATNREIAEQSGFTEAWLSQLFRQPWAQRLLAEMMHEAGIDETRELLKEAQADSVRKLIEVRDDPTTPKSVVRATCVDLLEQYSGKPTQRMQVEQVKHLTPEDVAELDKEIEQSEVELNRLTGKL